MVSIGSLDLTAAPRIAVPLNDLEAGAHGREALRWADLIELRADLFDTCEPAHVAAVCAETRRLGAPVLLTVRHPEQGGVLPIDDDLRLAVFRASVDAVDAVDVELRSSIFDEVRELAAAARVTCIASHHDFAATPPDAELIRIADQAGERGADIVKIATAARDAADRNRLLDLLRSRRHPNMIAIAMGPHGAASRVFFPLCGSLLTYGYLESSVAPGQMSIRELRAEIARYCPDVAPEREAD